MGLVVSTRERIGSFGYRGGDDPAPEAKAEAAKEDTHGAA
jgi:hypothetical protein